QDRVPVGPAVQHVRRRLSVPRPRPRGLWRHRSGPRVHGGHVPADPGGLGATVPRERRPVRGRRRPFDHPADSPGLSRGAIGGRTFTTEDVDSEGYKHLMDRILRSVADSPVYVSVDIDVLDPAYAPGTGTPESGGLTSREMVHFVRELHRANLVGFDLVEVAPQYDHTGQVTALAASNLL